MINPFKEINWKPGAAEIRKFAISLIIGFPVIAIIFFALSWWKKAAMPEPGFFLWLGGGGVAAGLLSLMLPAIGRLLYPVWYALAACIGLVMANVLFTVIYYLMFAPLGLFMRLIGRDPLRLRWNKEAPTHWIDAEPTPPPSRYFSQF